MAATGNMHKIILLARVLYQIGDTSFSLQKTSVVRVTKFGIDDP